MKLVTLSLFAAAGLATAAFAQTKSGSANVVDPYAPTATPNATTSKPAPQAGADTPVTTHVTVDANVEAAQMARMDTDKDGRVSLTEFTAGRYEGKVAATNQGGMSSGTGDATTAFKKLDADGDSYLSAAELAAATEKPLKK